MDLMECPECGGYGGFSHPHQKCAACNGKGKVPACPECHGQGGWYDIEDGDRDAECAHCNGSGMDPERDDSGGF